jgi:hypothetical protein
MFRPQTQDEREDNKRDGSLLLFREHENAEFVAEAHAA